MNINSPEQQNHKNEVSPSLQLLDVIHGYWLAQVVHVTAKLNIADLITAGSKTADELAEATATNPDALYRLLRTGAGYGLLEEVERGTFALTPIGETLRSDVPGSIRDYAIAVVAPGHWLPFGRLDKAIETGQPTFNDTFGMDLWEYYAQNEEEGTHFAGAMSDLSAIAAQEVPASYDVSAFKKIVDVGGSHGMLLMGLLNNAPEAEGVLLDLPNVIEGAKGTIDGSSFSNRIQLIGGDFFQEIPSGGDLYVLKQILHDWPDEQAATILKNIHRAAAPQSKLIIVEHLIPGKPEPSYVFLVDLLMLILFGARERRQDEFEVLLSGSGYKLERVMPTTGLFSVIEAVRV